MNVKTLIQRLIHIPRRIVREAIMLIQVVKFYAANRLSRKPVIAPGGPVVSLTTYGKRSHTAYFAIESIASGRLLPSRLILWIDDENIFNHLPSSIRRLQRRGLEVKMTGHYGPHKKYYPYIESQDDFAVPLVTADDDVFYPDYWLEFLVEANTQHPGSVNCFWAHVMNADETGMGRYADYRSCSNTLPSFRNIAIGAMGVIYPPSFLTSLRRAGTTFMDSCPKADDVWLHVQSLRQGFKVRQVLPKLPYYSFQDVPGSQQTALSYENVTFGDGNDRQVRATYTDADIRLLRSEQ